MEKRFCSECGTAYAMGESQCPACGYSDSADTELFQEGSFELSGENAVAADLGINMADLEGGDNVAYNWEDILAEIGGSSKEDDDVTVFTSQESENMPLEPAADEQEEPETVIMKPEKPIQEPVVIPAVPMPEMPEENETPEDYEKAEESEENIAQTKKAPSKQPRPRKKKKGGGKKILVAALIVVILAAGAFAAKEFGVLDMLNKQEETEEEAPELPVNADCTGVTLSKTEVTLTAEGDQHQLEATVEPAGCTDNVVWASVDPSVVTVDAGGKLTAVAAGETDVMVTVGSYAATCAVTVEIEETEEIAEGTEADPEEGAEIDPEEEADTEPEEDAEETETTDGEMALSATDITLFYPGEQARLSVTNGGDAAVVWSTDNDVIVNVDETGLVTARGTGIANVYAEVDGKTLTCIVRCALGGTEGEAVNVSLNATDITLFNVGENFQFKVNYANGEPEGVTHTWNSSDEAVCTIDENGVVTVVGAGVTYITTTANGVNLQAVVHVNIATAGE